MTVMQTKQPAKINLDDILSYGNDPEMISFAGGFPDPKLFPEAALKQAYLDAINEDGQAIFQYHTAQGDLDLRQRLADRMRSHCQVATNADDVMLTQGGQQAISLIAQMLLTPGDGVVVEAPTYLGALDVFNRYQPHYYEVPMDESGMDVDQLASLLANHPEIKLIYTVPDFQNPTGATLSAIKRQRIAELAAKYQVVVLEDSPYRDLSYNGSVPPAIKHFDQAGQVIFVSSFSKILSPALRTGWVVANQRYLKALISLKGASDLQSPQISLRAINQFLSHQDIDVHIAQLRSVYREKRDTMLAAIDRYFPKNVIFTKPKGGFFIWATLPVGIDAGALLADVAVPQNHIAYVPACCEFAIPVHNNGMRLSFVGCSPAEITRGIKRLGEMLTKLV